MYTITHHAGRLVEVRIATPVSLPDLEAFKNDLRAQIMKLAGQRVLLATDLTAATVFPQDVSDGFVAIMRGDNPFIERSVFLVSHSATFGLQVERMLREAQNPMRRAFSDRAALLQWMADVLDDAEKERLARHFSGHR